MDQDDRKVGESTCRIDVNSRLALCNEGKEAKGCMDGQKVHFHCGCPAQYLWGFMRSQRASVPRECDVPLLDPPALPSGHKFSSWVRGCQPGAVTECASNASVSNISASDTVEPAVTPVRLGESMGSTSTPALHLGFFSGLEPASVKKYKVSLGQQNAAHLCSIKESECHQELDKHVKISHETQVAELKSYGLRFAPGFHQWSESGRSAEEVKCEAVFNYGLAVCNQGPRVQIECDTAQNGHVQLIQVGCECQGLFAIGRLRGAMSGEIAAPCAAKMQLWSRAAEQRYMRTEAAELCAANAVYKCNRYYEDQQRKAIYKEASLAAQMEAKVINLQSAVRAISKENVKAQRVEQAIHKKMASPAYTYSKVPGFGFADEGEDSEGNGACRNLCNNNGHCKSYSYNDAVQKCALSSETIDYDDNFVLYLRATKNGQDLGHFIPIPGMKIGVDAEEETGATLNTCKYDCFSEKGCTSVSFSERGRFCLRSKAKITVGSDWDYYEKDKLGVDQTSSTANYFSDAYMHTMRTEQAKRVKETVAVYKDSLDNINSKEP